MRAARRLDEAELRRRFDSLGGDVEIERAGEMGDGLHDRLVPAFRQARDERAIDFQPGRRQAAHMVKPAMEVKGRS